MTPKYLFFLLVAFCTISCIVQLSDAKRPKPSSSGKTSRTQSASQYGSYSSQTNKINKVKANNSPATSKKQKNNSPQTTSSYVSTDESPKKKSGWKEFGKELGSNILSTLSKPLGDLTSHLATEGSSALQREFTKLVNKGEEKRESLETDHEPTEEQTEYPQHKTPLAPLRPVPDSLPQGHVVAGGQQVYVLNTAGQLIPVDVHHFGQQQLAPGAQYYTQQVPHYANGQQGSPIAHYANGQEVSSAVYYANGQQGSPIAHYANGQQGSPIAHYANGQQGSPIAHYANGQQGSPNVYYPNGQQVSPNFGEEEPVETDYTDGQQLSPYDESSAPVGNY